MKKIKFTPTKKDVAFNQEMPNPASRSISTWYKESPNFILNGKGYRDYMNMQKDRIKTGGGAEETFKNCQPLIDALTSGYMLVTPCDITVILRENGDPHLIWNIDDKVVDNQNIEVLGGHFPIPEGYHPILFRWFNKWQIETPQGYSCLFTHPLNRVDLPFISLSGIVDSDKHPNSVLVPFFLKKDFEGIIEAGTPVAQVIPFKREEWKSEKGEYSEKFEFDLDRVKKYMIKTYRRLYWTKKIYR